RRAPLAHRVGPRDGRTKQRRVPRAPRRPQPNFGLRRGRVRGSGTAAKGPGSRAQRTRTTTQSRQRGGAKGGGRGAEGARSGAERRKGGGTQGRQRSRTKSGGCGSHHARRVRHTGIGRRLERVSQPV